MVTPTAPIPPAAAPATPPATPPATVEAPSVPLGQEPSPQFQPPPGVVVPGVSDANSAAGLGANRVTPGAPMTPEQITELQGQVTDATARIDQLTQDYGQSQANATAAAAQSEEATYQADLRQIDTAVGIRTNDLVTEYMTSGVPRELASKLAADAARQEGQSVKTRLGLARAVDQLRGRETAIGAREASSQNAILANELGVTGDQLTAFTRMAPEQKLRAYATALGAAPVIPKAPENPAGGGGGGPQADAMPSNTVALLNTYANEPHLLSPEQQSQARSAIAEKMGGW
jgi:hypothetical protein